MPDFRLVRSAPPFEVRDYPENQAIEVDVSGERTDAEARGLALISAYLATGLHKSPEAAAAATFPVAEIEASFGWTIHVPLPRELSGSASRPPLGARLRIVTVPAQQVLAVVMSGAPTAADFERARGSLFDFARRQNLTLQTPTWIVVYAPPKTLWFIQRNEVLAPIAPAPEK